MAIAIVGSGQTGSLANSLLAISPTAAAGDMLYCFVSESAAATAPSVTDNLAGTWTVEATSGETASALASIWFAWKKAAGGETEIKVTPGAGATGQGICYLEASGAAAEAPEHLLSTGKEASSLTHASPEISCAAGDLVFVGFGLGVGAAEIAEWNNAMTNIGSAACRCPGGYFIAAEALTAKVFTATLKVTKAGGILAVALKPAAGGATEIPLQAASATSSAVAALTAATAIPLNAASSESAAQGAVTASPQIPLQAASSTSAASAPLTAPTQVPLQPAASGSAASVGTLTAPTTIPLQPASSASSAQGQVTAGTGTIPLQPAQSSSSAAPLEVKAPTTIPLQPASALSSAQGQVSAGSGAAWDALAMLL